MAEYIEREKLLAKLHEVGGCGAAHDTWADGYDKAIDVAYGIVQMTPAADVAEVKHAHWVLSSAFEVFGGEEQAWGRNPIADCSCSNCHKSPYCEENFLDDGTLEQIMTDFCPHCGARMDGEGE